MTATPPNALTAAGFDACFTAASASPDADGYIGTRSNLPYHVHPAATPELWAMLQDALADGSATVRPWQAVTPAPDDLKALAKSILLSAVQSRLSARLGEGPSVEVDLSFSTGRMLLAGLVTAATHDPAASHDWYQQGAIIPLTSAQVITLGAAVGNYTTACYASLADLNARIEAGAITDATGVMAHVWPATSLDLV